MAKNNLKSRPPKIDKSIEAFIEGAENKKKPLASKIKKSSKSKVSEAITLLEDIEDVLPWEEMNVRADMKKIFSLRFNEPYMLKLQYIQRKTDKSMQKFCLEHILPAIDQEVDRLVSKEL